MKKLAVKILDRNILTIILLAFILFFIRSYDIQNESLYGDEPYSIYQAQKKLPELKEIFLHDQNPPLHITLLHFWLNCFGTTDVSAKMFSIICSILSGIILFVFSKKFLNTKAAFLSWGFFLLSNSQQFYATEVRPYALIQLLCIGSLYFYFNILTDPQKKDIIGLALINTLLLYAHYLTIFILIVQGISIFLFLKSNKKSFIYYVLSQTIVALLFLPWIKVLFDNIPKEGSFWSHAPNYNDFRWHINLLLGNNILYYIYTGIAITFILLVIANKRKSLFSKEFNAKIFIVFLLLFIIPIILDFFIAQFTPVFLTRYILYSTFGIFLLTSYCITNLKINGIYKTIVLSTFFVYLLSSFQIKQEREDDWKSIIPMIKKTQDDKTVIFICASYKFKDFAFYYDIEAFKDYNNSAELLAKEKVFYSPNDSWFGWEKLNFDSINKIIYVQSHNQFEDPENKNIQFIQSKGFRECDSYKKINTGYTIFIKSNLECNPTKIISENKNSICDPFECYAGIDANGDSLTIYKSSFEDRMNCNLAFGTSEIEAFDGSKCQKTYKENEYGITLTRTISELQGKFIIDIASYLNCAQKNEAHLVVSVENDGKTLFRDDIYIPEKHFENGKWVEFRNKSIIPNNLPNNALVKIYFWNPSLSPIFIDKYSISIR